MDLARKKLGVMLSTGPEHANLETVIGLSEATLARGAAGNRRAEPALRTAFSCLCLPDRGAKVFVCAYGCQKRGRPLTDGDRVTYCGLVVLTDLINGTDRFVALN